MSVSAKNVTEAIEEKDADFQVTVGTDHRSFEALKVDVECSEEVTVRGSYNQVISAADPTVKEKRQKAHLLFLTLEELGFEDPVSWLGVNKRAQELDLSICSLEVVFQLALQYHGQPEGESLKFAHEPVRTSSQKPRHSAPIFALFNRPSEDTSILRTVHGYQNQAAWDPESRFVFVQGFKPRL